MVLILYFKDGILIVCWGNLVRFLNLFFVKDKISRSFFFRKIILKELF